MNLAVHILAMHRFWPAQLLPLLSPTLMATGPGTGPSHQASGSGLGRWRQALRAAGLSGLLRSPGPLTLLAPTDAAFEALLAEQSLSWQSFCADTVHLRPLLLGHVLHGSPLQPGHLHGLADAVIEATRGVHGDWLLSDANRRQAHVLPSSAAARRDGPPLHRIDRVLLPPQRDLMQQLHAQADLHEFTPLLESTGLASLLRGGGPFTIFAPANASLPWLAARLGLRPRALAQHPELLTQVLGRHLLTGRWLSEDLPWGNTVLSVAGEPVALGALGLIGAQPLRPGSDLLASNGVIHRIDQALLPVSVAD